MTKEEKPSRLYIPQPFASKTGAALSPIALTSSNNPNFEDGFPSRYSSPKSGGGAYITRGQMNAIGNLASVNQFCDACGGIVTFDATLSTKIGGYPRGAILQYATESQMYFVMSLVDNNTVNFNDVGIDNINWKIVGSGSGLNAPSWSRKNASVLTSGTEVQSEGWTMLASGKFKGDGYIRGIVSGSFVANSGSIIIAAMIGGNPSSVLPSPSNFDDSADCEEFAIAGYGSNFQGSESANIVPVQNGVPYSIWMFVSGSPSVTNFKYFVRFYS